MFKILNGILLALLSINAHAFVCESRPVKILRSQIEQSKLIFNATRDVQQRYLQMERHQGLINLYTKERIFQSFSNGDAQTEKCMNDVLKKMGYHGYFVTKIGGDEQKYLYPFQVKNATRNTVTKFTSEEFFEFFFGAKSLLGKYVETDDEIVRKYIDISIKQYDAPCPCPYSMDEKFNECGKRSAWYIYGGKNPTCYKEQVTNEMIDDYRKLSAQHY
jgi:hypothetical protein